MSDPVDLRPYTEDALAADPRLAEEVAASGHPLVLLPVRLETRYRPAADGTPELLVRVYPDQVHVDAHDPRLSAAEQQAGREFWRLEWHTGANTARQQRAWAALAERFGAGRAAWVARATRPTNQGQRPPDEVGDDEPLRTAPTFPTVELSEDRRTPVARLLPERWTASAYADGALLAVATGAAITGDPAVGPDLAAALVDDGPGEGENDEVAAVDTRMSWLVDFETAEADGMALRLPVAGPVDLLLVSGVRAEEPVAAGRALVEVLDAHRYSDGLAFLDPEVTTNNAEGSPSGWSSEDPGGWAPSARPLVAGSVGELTAAALGLRGDEPLGPLPGAGSTDPGTAEAMATTLWTATWGYWLTQFAGVGLEAHDWAREHARRFLRPGGPLPAVRVGRQPYGLLPVTSLGRFEGDERQNRLRRILVGLVDGGWRPVLAQVPRVGRGEVAADLVDVLRLEGRSDRLRLRRSVGARFAENLQRFLGRSLTAAGFWDAARDRAQPVASAAGLGLLAGALTVHEPQGRPVTLPLVSADGDLDHLTALLDHDPDDLAGDASAAPVSLLGALVRHGLLREHATAAARLLAASAADAELYGFGDPDQGWAAQRTTTLPGGGTVRERIADGDPASAPLAAFREAVTGLAAASVGPLERHLLAGLDAASHRLDAWVTSLATARLADLRTTAPEGVRLGGYGWVERLEPGDDGGPATEPPGEPGPLLFSAADPGFVHAPSIHQAQVAALLRNAHLAHGGGEQDPFAVSLTSERLRLARWIFDGVRAGRSLGAVLGYLVERDLHDRGLDQAVDNAREVTPMPGQEDLPVAARRLDGLRLHQLWAASEGHAVDHLVGGSQDASERARATGVLRALGVAVDAAADALQVEQVHQFARGNLTASVSTVADLDRGLAPPPALDFHGTPRTGAAVTHRVVVLLDPDGDRAAGWAGPADSARAAADPGLDAWLSHRLGPATGRTLRVGSAGGSAEVPLAELGLAAADLVRLAAAGEGGLAELAFRAAATAGLPLDRPTLEPDRPLLELVELARSLAGLLAAASPLDGSGLQPPHADPVRGIDAGDLDARLAAARTAVTRVVAALADALAADPDVAALQAAVLAAGPLGVGEPPADGTTAGPWVSAAGRVRAALETRLAEADALTATGDPPDRAGLAMRRLAVLLGPGATVLPRFEPATAAELAASRDDPALAGDDPLAAEVWLTRMERVREPLRAAGIALREAEALTGAVGDARLDLAVAQVPHRPGATWNALPSESYVEGAASLLLVGGDLLDPGRVLSGLLVDEWSEVVPAATQTTGVAFRYDTPEAMAPHAILLAVPPVVDEPWTQGRLQQVLVETLELAHLRAVPPDALGAVRQYLPAATLAFNAEGDAVSTDPAVLTPDAGG